MTHPKAAPEPSAQDEMPPLPKPEYSHQIENGSITESTWEFGYTSSQITAYGQACAQWQATRQAELTAGEERGVNYIMDAVEHYASTKDESSKNRIHGMLLADAIKMRNATSQAAPSDLHAAVMGLPLPPNPFKTGAHDYYTVQQMRELRAAAAELVANAAPSPSLLAIHHALGLPEGESVELQAIMIAIHDLRTSPVQTAVAVPDAVKLAGAKMANTMFNLAQGDIGEALRDSFKRMQIEWDAAIRAAHPQEPK